MGSGRNEAGALGRAEGADVVTTFIVVTGWTGEESLEEFESNTGDISQSFARYLYHEHAKDAAADFRYDQAHGTEYFAPIPMTFKWIRHPMPNWEEA